MRIVGSRKCSSGDIWGYHNGADKAGIPVDRASCPRILAAEIYFRFLMEISNIGWLHGVRAFLVLWSWLAINAAYAYTPQSACCPYQLTHHLAWLKAAAPHFGEDSKMLPHWWVPEMRTSVVVVVVFVIVQQSLCQWLWTTERNSGWGDWN